MRRHSITALTFIVSLFVGTSAAQAVVVDMNAVGQPSITYNPYDRGGYFGVRLVPGTTLPSTIPAVTSSSPCVDPALSPDLILPGSGLCSHGGAVIHSNETFALTWDPVRRYWQTTRNYVEQFLSNVAAGSGTLTSPYAVTGQYTDATGRAGNASVYGGGCIDYGNPGGYACRFGNTTGTGGGFNYPAYNPAQNPATSCHFTGANAGTNQFHEELSGAFDTRPNDTCLTDAQLQQELTQLIPSTGLLGRTKPGYTPLIVLLTPPGVVVCLDTAGTLCSANGVSTAPFCSYHSQVNVGGTEVAYVVAPWTASWGSQLGCDDPGLQPIPPDVDVQTLATDVGARLVSPISQGHVAAIVNPGFDGWFARNGAEINDNGCVPFPKGLDLVTVGSGSYYLEREFNNAGVIETEPNALACTPNVNLSPTFVVPSAVNAGDVVQFDGSTSASTLIVPRAGYAWDFGDGTTAVGPSVVHTFGKGGNFSVKLTVTDRGGNVASVSQTISVLGSAGQPPPPPPGGGGSKGLILHLRLLPQSLRTILRSGVAVRVSSNEPADGIASLSISKSAGKRAHIRTGRGPTVVIGRGTVSGIKNGTVQLHLRLSRAIAAKLQRLGHVTVTVRLALVAGHGDHSAIDVAGRY